MRWPVLEETVVVRVVVLAPPAFRVVAGLFGEQRRLLGLEIDGAVAIGVAVGFVHDVHGDEGMPAAGPVVGPSR
jgi:hypothetical protein